MGRCRICGNKTRYNYPLCRTHFYFNYKEPRFWIALILTIFWEIILNHPFIGEDGVILAVMKALSDATDFWGFKFGLAAMHVLIFVGSFMFITYKLYMWFFRK